MNVAIRIWIAVVAGVIWILGMHAPWAGAEDPGTVSGVIRVEQAKVKTDGPKSFKDVVVYLEPAQPGSYPPPAGRIEMDQRGLVFIPHVMAIQKGATVDFLNNDNDRHNVYFLFDDTGDTLDIGTWGPGQTVSHTFDRPGVIITLCQLHLEMAAYILIFDHPYFTVAEIDADSQKADFRFDSVPPGHYRVKAWHKNLFVKGGSADITVAAGENVQHDIVITKKKYAK